MGHPQVFVVRLGINRKRQIVSPIQYLQLARNDFDIAGGEIWVFCPRQPRCDATGDPNDVFAAQCMRLLRKLRIFLRPKHDLCQAFAIAEINENYPAMIACALTHPARATCLPMSLLRSELQLCVRYMFLVIPS